MSLHPDFVDLLAAFAAAEVRYLLIGGYAVGFHAEPRFTKDIDLLIGEDAENARRVHEALRVFGAPAHILKHLEQLGSDEILFMGAPPVRIDIFKRIPGIEFEEAFARRVVASWSGSQVSVISLDDLIAAKRAVGREQDWIDIRHLEAAQAALER